MTENELKPTACPFGNKRHDPAPDYGLAPKSTVPSLCAVMILTAQHPVKGAPSIPLSFLEEVGRVLSEHKAVRVVPEDEVVTVDEAASFLGMPQKEVCDALKFGVLRGASLDDESPMIRLDSLLEFQRKLSKPGPLDETAGRLIAAGLY